LFDSCIVFSRSSSNLGNFSMLHASGDDLVLYYLHIGLCFAGTWRYKINDARSVLFKLVFSSYSYSYRFYDFQVTVTAIVNFISCFQL
jgi:hypothetical protein